MMRGGSLLPSYASESAIFGERPLCKVLRPHFYDPEQWHYLKHETETILGAFGKAHQACMADDTLRAELGLEWWEEQLYTLDTGMDVPWTTSRLDSFYDTATNTLRFTRIQCRDARRNGLRGSIG